MSVPSAYAIAAIVLLSASAFHLFKSGVVFAQLQLWRQVGAYGDMARALLPPWFVREMITARLRGRSTRLVRKRYRSLRRRALRRNIHEFVLAAEPLPVDSKQLGRGMLCALGGFAAIVFTVSPPNIQLFPLPL